MTQENHKSQKETVSLIETFLQTKEGQQLAAALKESHNCTLRNAYHSWASGDHASAINTLRSLSKTAEAKNILSFIDRNYGQSQSENQ